MLDKLAAYFRNPAEPMPEKLSEYWDFVLLYAKTKEQQRIVKAFKRDPSELNKQKLETMLREALKALRYEEYFHEYRGNIDEPLVPYGRGTGKDFINYIKPFKKRAAKKRVVKKKVAKKIAFKGGVRNELANGVVTVRHPRAPDPRVKVYTNATIDKQAVVKKASPVTVTLSREKIAAAAGKLNRSASARVSPKKKLRVQIKPILNCKTKGDHTYTIPVPAEGKPRSLDFAIIPTHKGKAKFSVDVWQGYELACSMELEVSAVVKKTTTAKQEKQVLNNETGRMTRKVNQLRINETQIGNRSVYDYEVSFEDIDEWYSFKSPIVNTGTANYISKLYKKIDELYDDSADNKKEFEVKLKTLGADLFLTLIPKEMQELFYKNRNKLNSIQIISTEPNIPWEMMVIRNPDIKKATRSADPFFAELGVVRWIKRGSFPEVKLQCRVNKGKFVIPTYQDTRRVLPAAQKEIDLLKNTFQAKQVPATTDAVELLLKSGRFDLLHFCCHGEGENNRILGARLVLQEERKNGNWKPTYLEQSFVAQSGSFIKNGSPQPIVVLNGCRTGILGKKLVGYGGFAKAFIEKGAGVFVGGLWALEDNAAFNFVSAFYASLKKGRNLSDATIEARKQSRAALNATWLSYVVYGNPFAKLVK